MPETPTRGSLEDELNQACDRFGRQEIPGAVLDAAEQCVLDWLGCAIIGAEGAPARALAAAHEGELGSGMSLCLTGPTAAPPALAALINGTASHTAELDDIYSPALYHPGAPVIAAALAATQMVAGDGSRFLRSVIAGYEISNRIGMAVNPAHYEFWHTTGTIGTIGAAVAAGLALGLSEEQLGWAIGNAASMAAGLQQAFRSDGMTKPLHAGRAAEGGLLAARAAKAGLTGADRMLSGEAGLGRAMSDGPAWPEALQGLFVDFTIVNTTFKRFSACGHAFAAVDGVLDLVAEQPIDPSEVLSVEVSTYQKAIDIAGIGRPSTAFEARFSIPFCVAAALTARDLSQASTYEKSLGDPAIGDLLARVTLRVDSEIDAVFPRMRGARIAINLMDGDRRETFVPTRKGEPLKPLTNEELTDKFRRLVSETGLRGSTDDLLRWTRSLRDGGSIGMESFPIPKVAKGSGS